MRAERLIARSFECASGTTPSRRLTRSSGWGARCLLLVIVGGAVTLLAFWLAAARWGDTAVATPATTQVSNQELSAAATSMPRQSVGPISAEQDSLLFHGPTVDAAFLKAAAVVSLMLLHWPSEERAKLCPGTAPAVFVPG